MGMLKNKISEKILNQPNFLNEMNNVFAHDVPVEQDLSTFTTTDIPDELNAFMGKFYAMNIAISPKAFPSIPRMEEECLDFIANLFHAPKDKNGNKKFFGMSTVGSSEACIMAGVSMLFNWKARNEDKCDSDRKPNIIISDAYQICWKKFADLFGVELRLINTEKKHCTMLVEDLQNLVDDYTIGVVALFANTLTGCYDNIQQINDQIEKISEQKNMMIPIHIDAASGGFYAPFVTPDLKFDFRLKNVTSISVSGHKFGFVPPSIGWLIFREGKLLNNTLKNELDYLGGGMLKDIGINFSKSGMPLVGQYFLIKLLGMEGYKELVLNVDSMANYLAEKLQKISNVNILTRGDISTIIYNVDGIDMAKLEGVLREQFHWQVPTYKLPNSDIVCQRIVVRTDMTVELADKFVADFCKALKICSETV